MSSMLKRLVPAALLLTSVAAAYQVTAPGAMTAEPATAETTPLAARPKAVPADPEIAAAIAEWTRLRQSDGLPFGEYARFLAAHPGWPGELAMRRTAERRIVPDQTAPSEIVLLFDRQEPLTNTARARYAAALAQTGRQADAQAQARRAWTGGAMDAAEEARLAGRFSFAQADQDARMERLLWDRATAAAARQIALVGPERRQAFAVRLALQQRAPDAEALAAALPASVQNDAGYVLDRATWLRDTARASEARAYLALPRTLAAPPLDPARWLALNLRTARDAANDTQYSYALAIAQQLPGTYAPGTLVRDKPFAERDDYTSLAWLGATTAMQKLGRPADAIALFNLYGEAAQSPGTRTKGWYWAGRAAAAAGRQAEATAAFERAAGHFDQFYGQLAAERLGRPIPAPPAAPATVEVAAEARAAFDRNELVRAARWLGGNGSWQDQSQFVRAISSSVRSDADHLLAAELARDLVRPDLGVMVARSARIDGSSDYVRSAFPEVSVPPAMQHHWVMMHAIMRQESQFDREAQSHVGARGLMQLMPGTARETAGKLGLPYDIGRLVTDPHYNMMLGSTYFAAMLDRYGGNHVLALAAYNAGPGNANKFIRANGDPRDPNVDVIAWIEAIPLTETRGYVQRVLENAVVYGLLNPDKARLPAQNRLSAYLGRTAAAG